MALIACNLLGIAVLLLIAFIFSTNRRAIRLRTIGPALLAQVGIGAFILFVPFGKSMLSATAAGVNHVLGYCNAGIEFLFGGLVQPKMFELFGNGGFVFAVRVLPAITFVTALISVLYYLGIMHWIVLGTVFQKLLGVSKIESFSAVTTIFLSQSEMPAVVKPFPRDMTSAELFAVMSSGMAAVAGSVLAGYAGLGVKVEYLLAASFMAVPGGLLFAKIIHPTSEASRVTLENLNFDEKRSANVIEAASSGATVGLKIAVMVGAMMIALLNGIVGGIGGWFGDPNLSMQSMLGAVFAPLAYLSGVPWDQAVLAGNFLGQKLILNEFVAYASLSPYLKDSASVAAAGLQAARSAYHSDLVFRAVRASRIFVDRRANRRRAEVARYGLRVVLAATLSNLMSATIAGMFLTLN
ncbi:MAG: Na+ dependent nucleoside transporter NupC [uncultured Caballeronia sp.]|nr:MAG: Na+ dependent nucleoside transporter NupC [uncultured Caballeronia sp.]